MNGEQVLQVSLRAVIKRFLLMFLPLAMLLSGVTLAFYYKDADARRAILDDNEIHRVDAQKEIVDRDFEFVFSDLLVLSTHHALRMLMDTGKPRYREALSKEFLAFARSKHLYDQMRLLDDKGREVISVNSNGGNPYAVPARRLQSKGERYFFQHTFRLGRGEVYISPFELNVEGGEVEQPPKPVIRLGTPVFDSQGQKRGVVMLNYLGTNMLHEIRDASASAPGQVMLLNSAGFWLMGPRPEDEWAFMYEDRQDRTFANAFPNAWPRISAAESGQFVTPKGMFTFTTVYPLVESREPGMGELIKRRERHWKIVSYVPADVLNAETRKVSGRFGLLFIAFMVLGALGSWFVARADVTRRLTEGILRESEERYRRLVESTPSGIVVHREGKIIYINTAAVRMAGATDAREILGKPVLDFVHPDHWEIVKQRIRQTQEEGRSSETLEEKFVRLDGRTIDVEVTAIPFTHQGEPATLVVFQDITLRKQAEEELLRAEKLESLSLLAGGIAHDFNNLLTAVLGNVDLAKMYAAPEGKVYERLTEAEKAIQRVRDLTQQLLTFSKGGAPVKQTASIADLIVDSTRFALRGSNVRCDFFLAEDLWPVEVDPGQISRVIGNLVINAVQAMPGGGTIRLSASNVTSEMERPTVLKEGRYISISVEDQGPGIPSEHLPKIFDPYFTTKPTGSGLGLATSYSIVAKHGGVLTVESEMGVGSTFYIYLPASQKRVSPKRQVEEGILAGQGRVLVVDDDEVVREVACQMLASLGYEAEAVEEGGEAIARYEEARKAGQPYDVVIMDLTVPGGMGGERAIKKLLEIDPDVKAIVSSGYANNPVIANFRQYGFSGVVSKPYRLQELGRALHGVMERPG
jgi:PAS domain S-box-containing protein